MSEPETFEELQPIDVDPDAIEPVLDPDEIAVTSHLDADEGDLIEQFLEVPEDEDDEIPDR
ncbi:hypothetical protein [Mycobacterium sp. URHB0044]|jgi:hypothetical protein|uniref:hypothetical protein n=1 Tax=Mycobacterium sp. URHB0044 TaxID=1380386 RepID=UPI0004916E3C|nr:hypothetical protein [Mycobacterium sp. URHB0044]